MDAGMALEEAVELRSDAFGEIVSGSAVVLIQNPDSHLDSVPGPRPRFTRARFVSRAERAGAVAVIFISRSSTGADTGTSIGASVDMEAVDLDGDELYFPRIPVLSAPEELMRLLHAHRSSNSGRRRGGSGRGRASSPAALATPKTARPPIQPTLQWISQPGHNELSRHYGKILIAT